MSRLDGAAAEALLARLRPGLAAQGITRLADITGLDCLGVPTALAVRPLGRSLAVSQGKGLAPAQAMLAAVFEALESAAAERHALPLRCATAADLSRAARIVPLDRLPRRRGAAPRDSQALLWVEGRDLTDGGATWLPYELVHSDYTLPSPVSAGHFAQSSNGLAAGTTREAALRHALLELVERDALALWQAEPADTARRRLDLASIEDSTCRGLLERVTALGFGVVALDITSDLGIATIACRLLPPEGEDGGMAHVPEGSAADLDPEAALLRALLEAIQTRATFIAGSRDDLLPLDYLALDQARELDYWRRLAAARAAAPAPSDLPAWPAADDASAVELILQRLAAGGLGPAIVVAFPPPLPEVQVLRVVVPGLEAPPHPAFAPGARALARGARP